jgi:hypothetical protein
LKGITLVDKLNLKQHININRAIVGLGFIIAIVLILATPLQMPDPDDWEFYGGKTSVYRQIGNAFPPLVVEAITKQLVEWVKVESVEKPNIEPTQLSLISIP